MGGKVAYEFGGFRFEPSNVRLLYGATVIPLTVKAADTLAVLVSQPDVLVTKDDLMTAVWPDTAVEENNLNQQISALRKALAQNGNGAFIETVPRRGYRFVGKVRAVPLIAEAFEPARVELGSATPYADASTVAHSEVRDGGLRPVVAAEQVGETAARRAGRGLFEGRRRLAILAAGAFLIVAAAGLSWEQYEGRRIARASEAARQRGDELLRRGEAGAAVTAFQQAIRLNATNARAYGALAHALHKQSHQASVQRVAGRSPSVEAAKRAVSLDPQCAPCHGTLGFFLFYHDWEWVSAEEHLREAIRLEPELESIRPSYALLLAGTGRLEQALEQIDFALSRQPYHVGWRVIRASILYLQRRYPEALAAADEALALKDTERGAWEWRSKALFQMGHGAEAVNALAQQAFAHDSAQLDQAVRAGGGESGVQRLLEITGDWRGRVEQTWRRAAWRALLDERDLALDELERACEHRNYNLIYIGVDPVYDRIRAEPRFQSVVAKMGLDAVLTQVIDEVARGRVP